MAEFCKKCADELGMLGYDRPPLFCEACKKYKTTFLAKVIKKTLNLKTDTK